MYSIFYHIINSQQRFCWVSPEKPEQSWNLTTPFPEPCWNRAGTLLEPSWNRAGTFLEPLWNLQESCRNGAGLLDLSELCWNLPGTFLPGALLEPHWKHVGTFVFPLWLQCLVVISKTSFRVFLFCGLLRFKTPRALCKQNIEPCTL